jgi:hypothetical protein
MGYRLFSIICVALLFSAKLLQGQCLLSEITIENKINNAALIVEGKVVSKKSFYNNSRSFIYTSNSIEVYKSFKGSLTADTIEIITDGGVVGDKMIRVSPEVELAINDWGVFILNPVNNTSILPVYSHAYMLYGGVQGLIKYDLIKQTASAPFQKYKSIKDDLYPIIVSIVRKEINEIKPLITDSVINSIINHLRATPVITGFTPTLITAGTNSVLTISGSGFGASQGSLGIVQFKNADDGGNTYIAPFSTQYISWNDNEIKLIVPKAAGTGPIKVSSSTGDLTTSTDSLYIPSAQLNIEQDDIASITYLVGTNKQSGITWRLNQVFNSNEAAKEAFIRALESWNCNTFINWKIGPLTSVSQAKNDEINVVSFDEKKELPDGTLAVCYNYWSQCQTTGSFWISVEMDMLISKKINWEYGPDLPTFTEYDFESAILHELGHGHQLAHVINPDDIMNYSIKNGEAKRILQPINIAAGNDVMSRSTTTTYCSYKPILALTTDNCTDLFEVNTDEPFTAYPNPTSGFFNISTNGANQNLSIECFNMQGDLVKTWNINNVSYFTSLDLSELPSGLYILRTNTGQETAYTKVIIQKVHQ